MGNHRIPVPNGLSTPSENLYKVVDKELINYNTNRGRILVAYVEQNNLKNLDQFLLSLDPPKVF